MRFNLSATALLLFLSTINCSAQDRALVFTQTFVQPNVSAYLGCANERLGQIARLDPSKPFEQIEGTLRPACGLFYDKIKDALYRTGLNRQQANLFVRNSYTSIQGDLRSQYERYASAEIQRREAVKAASLEQQRILESTKERDRLLDEAALAHTSCLIDKMREIVPFSNESAETLGQVVITKCLEAEKKYISLGVALYGISKIDAEKIVREALEKRKQTLVAEIVTFRVELTKSILAKPRSNPNPTMNILPEPGI